LFAGSDSGGERAASIYTIVRTAKLNNVNPETYLRDVLTKIAEGHTINKIDALLLGTSHPKTKPTGRPDAYVQTQQATIYSAAIY
jgi:hypothetical protein